MTAPLPSAVAETTRAGAHTPGPYARVGRCVCKYFDPNEVGGLRHATRWTAYVQVTDACAKGEAEAVAQLFAAAPDLLDALRSVLDAAAAAAPDTLTFDLVDAIARARTAVEAADRGGRDGL